MGASRLSPSSVRRIARTTGLDVVFAWSHHHYWHHFCTRDHRHGWWNCRSHDWEWDDPDPRWPLHYPDCYEWFDADGSFTLEEDMRLLANRMRDRMPPIRGCHGSTAWRTTQDGPEFITLGRHPENSE